MLLLDAINIVCLNRVLGFDDLFRMACCSKEWKKKALRACLSKTLIPFDTVVDARNHTCTECECQSCSDNSRLCRSCYTHHFVKAQDLGRWHMTPAFLIPHTVDGAGNLLFSKKDIKNMQQRLPIENAFLWVCSALVAQLRKRAYWQCLAIWCTHWPDPAVPFVGVCFPPPTHMPNVPLGFQMDHIAGRSRKVQHVIRLLRQWSGIAIFPDWVSSFAKRGWSATAIYNRLKKTKIYRKYGHGRRLYD